MRHFILLGFTSTDTTEVGEPIQIGVDRAKAITELNTPNQQFVRKELYELAIPHIRRHFAGTPKKPAAKKTAKA
jgi:hypothetical protein